MWRQNDNKMIRNIIYMLSGSELTQYLDKVIYFRTSTGLYLRIEDVACTNQFPTFIFANNRCSASEFILVKKSDNNVSIRLNRDIGNQNGTYGYHLYVIPENDVVYGAGNDELFAQFNIEKSAQYVRIKSCYKNAYLCHEHSVLRCRNDCCNSSFIIEDAHIPFTKKTICVISYGYLRKKPFLHNSPIINTLKEIYPQSSIDIHMLLPHTMDEFCDEQCDTSNMTSSRCNVSIVTHKNDTSHFMRQSHSYSQPIISNGGKIYPHRTMSAIWNITESIKSVIATRKFYDIYILMRNDMYDNTRIFRKVFDSGKLYCMVNNEVDSHLFIGNDILSFNYLYDFYIRNLGTYTDCTINKIMTDFLKYRGVPLGDIRYVTPYVNYPCNLLKFSDGFRKNVITKYEYAN